ncbi:cyclic nucleotide-gated cation channel beta-3-like isoform X1 [Cydia pomonella]|uniref:cyclic nucleotide-gated cation channel beta-3-like isoform X1 n=1 Tax=Cydia pomonella TaxID=82600 RepID=UPI002ADE89B3|nr:cyclic nucleotide-gated cation channel beta-3-like isoform X1 [Cydia pomonella]
MVMGLRFRLQRHTVHPSEPSKPVQNHVGPPKPYGSWCTPEASPAHVPITHTNSNNETKTEIRDLNAQCKGILLPPKKVRLFPSSPPHEYKGNTVIFEDDETELKDFKRSEIIGEPPKWNHPEKKPPAVETPQSPVPSSPSRAKKCKGFFRLPDCCDPFVTIDPQGRLYITWLLLVTFCYCYNAWCIVLRATFPYQTPENTVHWMMADYFCDLVYLLDVAFIKPRLMYLHEGFWVDDPGETRRNYRKKIQYKFDIISLTPLDFLYFYFGTHMVILRFPRLLKLQTFWEFNIAVDRVLSSPYVVRIGKTLVYIFYLIHLNACAYYTMSAYEGLGINNWVYDGQGNAYIRCFYFATKTATSIGKNPKPENPGEYMFMTVAWLMGVFVFALLIGQIRDIIATATRARTDYRKRVDGCTRYLRKLNMPASLQQRVTCWFNYTWNEQRCFDESNILNTLPHNMKQDVALEVHMSTLSKVELFRDCSDSLLRDLVLKLRPVSFLPGDVIVRRGDVGHQMYIIKSGQCYVMSPDENEVLATLGEGCVFGEISLLGIDGMRRRTATVRSRGYSNLFALSRNDLYGALLHHKEAALVLRRRADQIIRQNAARHAQQRMAERQARKSASINEETGLRRRRNSSLSKKSNESGGGGGGLTAGTEARRLRAASALSRRKLSVVSENKTLNCEESSESHEDDTTVVARLRGPVPKIVFSSD